VTETFYKYASLGSIFQIPLLPLKISPAVILLTRSLLSCLDIIKISSHEREVSDRRTKQLTYMFGKNYRIRYTVFPKGFVENLQIKVKIGA
jgi:hypothetical protein